MVRRENVKAQIKREFALILIGSLLIGVLFRIGWFFPVRLMIMSTLLINIGLAACMWYSEANNRPILYQVMVLFYLGTTAYCMLSQNEDKLFGASYDGKLAADISMLLLFGVLLVSLVSSKKLVQVVRERIDLWIPPLWPVVFAGVACYISSKQIESESLRMGVLLLMGGTVITTAYKNNYMQNRAIAYKITTRRYLSALCVFAVVIYCINQLIPKPNKLIGTELLKKLTHNWGKGFYGNMEETFKLDRNPSQSDEVLLKLESDRAVYLRKTAYSEYKDGEWKAASREQEIGPVTQDVFYLDYDLFELVIDKMSKGEVDDKKLLEKYKDCLSLPTYEPEKLSVFVEEVEEFDNYFTINGTKELKVSQPELLGCYGNGDNLFFTSMDEEGDIAYTIEYDQNKPRIHTREDAVLKLMTEKDFEKLLNSIHIIEGARTKEVDTLMKRADQYSTIWRQYGSLPEEINDPIKMYAEKITEGIEGDMAKAQQICDILKNSGVYTYEMGANYTGKIDEPVLDFLFYGKAGICQDFASSMTLLCRGAGLPARYVTGYYSVETSDEENTYKVRVKDGHAFVEVYIGGYGWMLFDPTPVHLDEGTEDEEDILGNNMGGGQLPLKLDNTKFIMIIFLVILGIVVWLYPLAWLRRIIWKWYLLRIPGNTSIKRLLHQTIQLLEEKGVNINNEETVSKLAKRLGERGIDITPITKPFEKFYYGGKEPTATEIEVAVRCYNQLKKRKTWK